MAQNLCSEDINSCIFDESEEEDSPAPVVQNSKITVYDINSKRNYVILESRIPKENQVLLGTSSVLVLGDERKDLQYIGPGGKCKN